MNLASNLDVLGDIFGSFWRLLRPFLHPWGLLKHLLATWEPQDPLETLLGASWSSLETLLGASGGRLGGQIWCQLRSNMGAFWV